MLDIPVSTLRNYARLFSDQLSSQQGRKKRLYTDRDLLVFKQVKDLSHFNTPISEIASHLVIGPEVIDKPLDSSLALIPSIAAELEDSRALARSALFRLASLETAMLEQKSVFDQTIENLTSQLAASREDQKAISDKLYIYLSLPWWKRLFYKFPHE
jgi:DNA-binding transcriptional MerR regulator